MTTVEMNCLDETLQDFSIQLGVQKFLENMDRVIGKKGPNLTDKGGQGGGLVTIQLLNGLISSLQLSTNHLSAHNILEHFGECKEAMGLSSSALEPADKSASKSALQVSVAADTCQNFHPKETRLLYTLQLISEEKFAAALHFLAGEGDVENGAPAISVLLSGLKTILEHICSENCDLKSLSSFMEPLEKPFVDVFTRISIFSLIKLNLKNKAEALLYKISDWKESEDDNDKSVIPTMAFNVANSYFTNASPRLITHLMERIAESDPANPVALELCRKYLEAEMILSTNGSDCETPDIKLDYLSRSLELAMLYVDEQSPSLTPALAGSINQAWEILAESLRRICTRGSEESISNLINLWHKGRKAWWPYQHFRNPANIRTSAEAVMLTNKAFCCYLLESENHPFVVSRKKTAPLSGLIAQLRPDKIIHDERVDAALSRMDYFKASKLFFQSQEPPRLPKEGSDFFTSTPSHIIREEESSPLDGFMSPTSLEDDALRLPQSDQSCYESAEEDAPYIPIHPSLGLEKAETSWSERLRSSGAFEEFSELLESMKETDEEDMSAQPLWLHRSESEVPGDWSEKAERWKEFIATGVWKELPDDPALYDDSTGSEMEIDSSGSDDRDSPTTDDCWEDETWLAKKFPSAFQPQLHQDQDSQPPLTPALSSIMACSPRLETSPKEVIPNRDRLTCFEFSENEVSLHNSTAEEIAHSISMIVKKLEDGPEGVPVDKEQDDYDVVLETEPEPNHTEPFPNLTRSSGLNVSSPDMFISSSSEEEEEESIAEKESVPAPTPSRLVVLDTSSEEDSSDVSLDADEARSQPTTSTPIISPHRKRRRLSNSLLRLKIKRMSPKKSPGSCKRPNKRRSMWKVAEVDKNNEKLVDQPFKEPSTSNAGPKLVRKAHTRVRNSAFWSSDSEDETAAVPLEKKDEEPLPHNNSEGVNKEQPDHAQMIEDILAMCRRPSVVKVPKKKKKEEKKMYITADAQMDLVRQLMAEKAPGNKVDAEKKTKKKKSTKS